MTSAALRGIAAETGFYAIQNVLHILYNILSVTVRISLDYLVSRDLNPGLFPALGPQILIDCNFQNASLLPMISEDDGRCSHTTSKRYTT